MADTYRIRLTGSGTAIGGRSVILERTAGTGCDEVSIELTNSYGWHPKRTNWMYREPEYTSGPCVVCVTPQEAAE